MFCMLQGGGAGRGGATAAGGAGRGAGGRGILYGLFLCFQRQWLEFISLREAALGAEVRLLREELAGAQEAAASAAGHAKQYQALATSSDEALRSMQVRQQENKVSKA